MPERPLDVLVIGGGQAGLAAGYLLRDTGLSFRIVEAEPRIGNGWRRRYRSLTLFTPRAFSELPGLPLKGDPEGYPSRNEFADYLESYAARFVLPVELGAEVVRLAHGQNGFSARMHDGSEVAASSVIVASGAFRKPLRHVISEGFDPAVVQLDAASYSGPEDVPQGRVLVVGDGATGRDIAAELAGVRDTALAAGKPRKLFPERVLGRSVWWWLSRLGLMRVGPQSLIGRLMRKADPFPDRDRNCASLERKGVRMTGRLIAANGRTARFDDGTASVADAVIWAAGYRDDFDWIDIKGALDARGSPLQDGGTSPVSGLYFLGRPWQRNRASALVMGAGDDARVVVDRIFEALRS